MARRSWDPGWQGGSMMLITYGVTFTASANETCATVCLASSCTTMACVRSSEP
jgi:hypothetical protein